MDSKIGRSSILLLCVVLSGVVSLIVGPDANWDLRNYHLYNPYAFLEGRLAKDIAPAQVQSFINPLADIPFYFLFVNINEYPALFTFAMGVPYGLCWFFLILISRQVLCPDLRARKRFTLIAMMVVIGGTGAATGGSIGSTVNETLISLPVLMATFVVLFVVNERNHLSKKRVLGLLLVAGLLAGLAAGLKLTYVIYAVAMGAGMLALLFAKRVSLGGVVVTAAGMFLGFGLVSAPWMLILWDAYGSPVFPFFNDVFQSPWLPAVRLADLRFLPKTLEQALFYPFYWVMGTTPVASELPFRDWRMATLWLATAFLVAAETARWIATRSRYRWPGAIGDVTAGGATGYASATGESAFRGDNLLFLGVTFAGGYILWLKGFGIYRYTVFLEFLSGPLIVSALSRLTRPGPEQVGILAMVTVLIFGTTQPQPWTRSTLGERFIDVQAPAIVPSSLVFLVGGAPQAYIIPFMEPTARYIGINNNLLRTDQDTFFLKHIRGLIEGHEGAIYALVHPRADGSMPSLTGLGLRVNAAGCKPIASNMETPSNSHLCTVERVPRPF